MGVTIIKNLQITEAGEGVEKRELSYTVGGNVNWYRHSGEQYGGAFKKLRIKDFKIKKIKIKLHV